MPLERAETPDWKDADAYAPLLSADRSLHAWEWLRRGQAYRAAARGALSVDRAADGREGAGRWGLHRFEPPERTVPDARPLWRRELWPSVLQAAAVINGSIEDRFDLDRFARFATLVTGEGGAEHLLLSDGRRAIRLDVAEGTLRSGPVMLRYRLAGLAGLDAPLLALRQLLALWRAGDFSRALHPPERRAARWVLLLRASDALAADASQREIAARLLGAAAGERRWRVEAPSLRSRAQRLVRQARRMAAGGYRELLAGR